MTEDPDKLREQIGKAQKEGTLEFALHADLPCRSCGKPITLTFYLSKLPKTFNTGCFHCKNLNTFTLSYNKEKHQVIVE